MTETDLKQGFYAGKWEVQPMHNRIVGPAGEEHLEPKVMDLLLILAERPGEVIEKQELIDRIWDGRAVGDEPLTQCVTKLRKAFHESQSVKNVPRRGYLIAYPVKPLVEDPPPKPPKRTQVRPALTGAAVALVIVLGIIVFFYRPPAENSIAILPLGNAGDSADVYWVDGFTDAVSHRLAGVPELKVAARTSAYKFRESDEDEKTIARKLGVAHLLIGSARKDGDEVHVTINLVDRDGFVMWSDSYSVNINASSALQDEIANTVLGHISQSLASSYPITTDPPTQNMDAYDLVLQGNYHLARRGEDSLRLSIGLFQEALQLDESYADAYVGLATAYAVLPFYSREAVGGSFDLATAILEKGAQMNANVEVLGASIIAFVRYHTEWQWIEAEEAFDTALQYTPNDSDLLNWYSVFLAGVGRVDQSLQVAERARDLDRLSPVVNQRLAVAHLWAGNNDMANEYFEIANELGMAPATQPEAYVILLMRQGEYALALQLLSLQQMMMGYDDAWVEALFVAMQDPQYLDDAVEVVLRAEQNGDITPLHLFGVWVYLGEEERAVDAALALIRDRVAFNSEFLFSEEAAALRQHARFGEIIRGIRLDTYWDYFGWPPMCEPQGADIVCY